MDKSNSIINFLMESFIIDNLDLSNPIFFNKSVSTIHKKIKKIRMEELCMVNLNNQYTSYKF